MAGLQHQHLVQQCHVGDKFDYRGGFEGARTEAKNSWFPWLPRMTSDTVLMVSVSTSAGTPLAIKMLHNFSKRPESN